LVEAEHHHLAEIKRVADEVKAIELDTATQLELVAELTKDRRGALDTLKQYDEKVKTLDQQNKDALREIGILTRTHKGVLQELEVLKMKSEGAVTREAHDIEMTRLDTQLEHKEMDVVKLKSRIFRLEKILGNGKKIGVTSPMEGAQPTHLQRQHGLLQKTELPPSPEVETSEDPTSPELLPDDHEQTLPSLNEILCS